MALPELNRIKRKKDFDFIFKNGGGLKGSLFIIKALDNNLKQPRFGFIISSKISKKAVLRNKIRRRISEIIGMNLKQIKGGLDIVFIALKGTEKADYKNIEKDVLGLLFKIKAIVKSDNV